MTKSEPAIEIINLKKSYGNKEALKSIDLVVEKGTVFALNGKNGAGKTTIVRILATLIGYNSGIKNLLRRYAPKVGHRRKYH